MEIEENTKNTKSSFFQDGVLWSLSMTFMIYMTLLLMPLEKLAQNMHINLDSTQGYPGIFSAGDYIYIIPAIFIFMIRFCVFSNRYLPVTFGKLMHFLIGGIVGIVVGCILGFTTCLFNINFFIHRQD